MYLYRNRIILAKLNLDKIDPLPRIRNCIPNNYNNNDFEFNIDKEINRYIEKNIRRKDINNELDWMDIKSNLDLNNIKKEFENIKKVFKNELY